MGWLVALGILLLVLLMPVGIQAVYNRAGAMVRLLVGPVKITLFPRKKKKETAPKEIASKKSNKSANSMDKPGGSIKDFLPLFETALNFLGDLRRKIRLDYLYLKVILANADPCDLAVNYGRVWASVGNILPHLERLFVIKDRNVDVGCDFTAEQTLISARFDITITVGRILSLTTRYGIRALREYLKIMNQRKGGIKR